jgi:hypothetical protein
MRNIRIRRLAEVTNGSVRRCSTKQWDAQTIPMGMFGAGPARGAEGDDVTGTSCRINQAGRRLGAMCQILSLAAAGVQFGRVAEHVCIIFEVFLDLEDRPALVLDGNVLVEDVGQDR